MPKQNFSNLSGSFVKRGAVVNQQHRFENIWKNYLYVSSGINVSLL